MLVLSANIEIKSDKTWAFNKVANAEVVRDAESLTDTCTLSLPKKVKWKDEVAVPVKRGDRITVQLGYGDKLQTAFRGYITKVGAKSPVVIECEDEMFMLKAKATKKLAYKSVTLQQLLEDQQIGVAVKVFGEQNIGAYRVKADTVAKLLHELKEQGIRSFFRYADNGTPTLYCGVLFEKQGARVQVFDNRRNITDDGSLDFQRAEELKLKVKTVSLNAKNKKITVEVGDDDGEVRTVHAYNKTEKELKPWAEQELKRLKRDGLTGSFEAFGGRLVDKLDTIGVILDGEKCGEYQVKKNTITYGTGGLRQSVEIGNRIDAK